MAKSHADPGTVPGVLAQVRVQRPRTMRASTLQSLASTLGTACKLVATDFCPMAAMDTEEETHEDQWWIASLGDALVWARMRIYDSGVAEIFNAEGEVLRYDDEDAARMAMLDAEFRAFDGLDDDDATVLGFELDCIEPPDAENDEELLPLMTEKHSMRH